MSRQADIGKRKMSATKSKVVAIISPGFVATNFAERITNQSVKAQLEGKVAEARD